MILKYLSFPVQSERSKNNSLISFDTSNVGIYIRCNEHSFGPEKSDLTGEGPTEYWKSRFTHFVNLTICERLFGHFLAKDLKLIDIKRFEEKQVCREVSHLFDLDTAMSFSSVSQALRYEIISLTRDRIDHNIPISHFTNIQLLTQFQSILQQYIADFSKRNLVILLDEYQELSSHQQSIFSEIISIRKPFFKIASLPIGLGISREKKEKVSCLIVLMHCCRY